MRMLQGVGSSMVQTAAYSILTLSFPSKINLMVGSIEASAGVGLSLGPVIGALLFEIGSLPMPFLTFSTVWLLLGLLIKNLIVECADADTESQEENLKSLNNENNLKYSDLLSNRRILFACASIFLAIFQYTFIDPILAEYMNKTFLVEYQISGYFFLFISVGYLTSWVSIPLVLHHFKNSRMWMWSSFIIGICTIMYGASNILRLSPSMIVLSIALFWAGFLSGGLGLPPMNEMITVGQDIVSFSFFTDSIGSSKC